MMLTKTCQVDNNLKWSCGGLATQIKLQYAISQR